MFVLLACSDIPHTPSAQHCATPSASCASCATRVTLTLTPSNLHLAQHCDRYTQDMLCNYIASANAADP